MTTEAITLELEPRSILGKKVKRLRRAGVIPVHLYGSGEEPRALQVEGAKLLPVLAHAGGNLPIVITVQGETGQKLAFVREIQWSPIRDQLIHVDFLTARANQPVTADVPVNLVGESPGAFAVNGTVLQQMFTVSVEALPLEMPAELEVDLETLTDPNETIRAGDIKLPANVTLLNDPEDVVARVEMPREEAVEVEEEEEGEGEAGAESGEEENG